ncbi:hypothetical protein Taro_007401 [Colocasia esculenta]|uniref:Uncharacterized protein n=1 Tax=Colocasia esculenta TaxID=4460 RepID=A0A843TVB1_COLES|nr:hypothetical protein [Colocasia esculenta]
MKLYLYEGSGKGNNCPASSVLSIEGTTTWCRAPRSSSQWRAQLPAMPVLLSTADISPHRPTTSEKVSTNKVPSAKTDMVTLKALAPRSTYAKMSLMALDVTYSGSLRVDNTLMSSERLLTEYHDHYDRLEIIIDTFIQSGYVPSLAEVSNEEGVDFLNLRGKKLWPIRIGCVDPKSQASTLSLLSLQHLGDEEPYFVSLESACDSFTRRQEACHIRKTLVDAGIKWDTSSEDLLLAEWFNVVDDSKKRSIEEFPMLLEEIRKTGWVVKNILLSSQEQTRYILVNDG